MKKIISYFRDCYLEDRPRSFVQSIYHRDIEHLNFIDSQEELLTGALPYSFYGYDNAAELIKRAYVYRQEKEILYCTLFLVGLTVAADGTKEEICAPLIFQSAIITSKEDGFEIALGEGMLRFNYRLLERVAGPAGISGQTYDQIEDMLVDGILEVGEMCQLRLLLESLVGNMDAIETSRYPKLVNEKQIKASRLASKRKSQSSFVLLPASCVALFKKGSDAQGIVQELEILSKMQQFSAPMKALFQNATSPVKVDKQAGMVASILSAAQQRVMQAVANHQNILMIGPPGTGKSYTIASLAMNYLSRGKSVLITSGRDQAVDVIATKIEEQLSIQHCIVRGGTKTYLKQLKLFLQDLLNGVYSGGVTLRQDAKDLRDSIGKLTRKRRDLERLLHKRGEMEVRLGECLVNAHPGPIQRIRTWLLQRKSESQSPLWETMSQYNNTLEVLLGQSRKLIAVEYQLQLAAALEKQRPVLINFLKALRSRTGGKKEELFDSIDFDFLLSVFPIWLVKLTDLHRVLPMETEMFDLVIIDEATQCDIASCLPVIQRAKTVVVTGDPKQLRHISFLSNKKMEGLLQLHGLDDMDRWNYRSNSVLDLYAESVADQDSVLFLNEHYRSSPDIIRFSNKQFYGNQLHLMTEKGVRPSAPAVVAVPCCGERNTRGVNSQEIDAVLEQVLSIVEMAATPPPSIGILSPFRNQVDAIGEAINKHVSFDVIERHKLLLGTAHTFQGEERDIMMLSLVVDNNSHPNVLRFLEKPDVFNVSITRARAKQYVYFSIDVDERAGESLLWRYLHDIGSESLEAHTNAGLSDAFSKELAAELMHNGFDVQTAQSIAGILMDVVIVKDGRSMGIDLIGYPGDFTAAYSMDRYRMCMRAGMKIFPLPYSNWRSNRAKCVESILSCF